MGKIIYAATPFRMKSQTGEIWDFIERQGHFPLSSLATISYSNFDKQHREIMPIVSSRIINSSDELWIFGIDDNSLREWMYARGIMKPARSLVKLFDYEWEERAKKEAYPKYSGVVKEILKAGNLPVALG